LKGWKPSGHVADLRIEDGAMQGRITDWDPFVTSPQFEIRATPWQRIEVRLKTNCGGDAEFFWTNTTETKYGGFSPGKETHFPVVGDDQWHVYEVYPYWHREGKIILLRLDFPRPEEAGEKTFAVEYVRIVELGRPEAVRTEAAWDFTQERGKWSGLHGAAVAATARGVEVTMGESSDGAAHSESLRCPIGDRLWLFVEMAVDKGPTAYVRWVSSEHSGMASHKFPIRADGRFHTYNVDMASSKEWSGDLLLLGLTPSTTPGAKATIRRIAVSEDPLGPPEVEATYAGLENAINRVGPRLPFILNLINRGGEVARDLRIVDVRLPPNVTVARSKKWRKIGALEPFDPATHRFYLSASAPTGGEVEISLAGEGAPDEPIRGEIEITPSLNLPKADYVPEPQPVESDYEIGAYYFPGWNSMARWEPIRRSAPERKPVLGWYDEANPECADWQIKWAVEHGIKFFMVDWYWSAGARHLEHWVHDAYMNARYRKYLKWCMMWANHNRPNTHSEDDQRAVTKYWIDNYFGMDEYYRIDDMPVVIIWSVANMRRDMGGSDGVKRLLNISQQMARDAGYKGIYFVAMKWPEASTDPRTIARLRDEGFMMTSIYHYMGHGGKADDPRHYPFELVAESTYPFFKAWHEADPLPFLPNISTGWDSRPWHGDRATVIYGRTVPLFERICRDAKRFADETGLRRVALGPLNEWGEGSYIEPCKEFGFGMYDAIRDTFCKQPPGGWPPNVAPQDVGLGPYDFPEPKRRYVWDFEDGAQGWSPMMGITDFKAQGGAITFRTSSNDPALLAGPCSVAAREHPFVAIRMKIDGLEYAGEKGQLFWATPTVAASEATSVRFDLIGDGKYHIYVLPVGENNRWRGRITSLRFDPCSHAGAQVSIDEIRLSRNAR
ncbi:MAG: glycoside hydrolase family 99-like domain-containing protein, partial [Armatimonadota bacterium]